jgi:hypothetical protein
VKAIPTFFARGLAIAAAGLLLASGNALAQISQDTPFPSVPDRTIDLGGDRQINVYKATVMSARGNRLTVRFDHGERFTYDVPPDYRFEIDGRKVRTRDLNRGDVLTAYVTVSNEADHEIHHVEESGGTATVIASTTPEPVTDSLPTTASPLPLIGLLGALSLGLGGLGFAVRRRLSNG